jgi:hypothetical protein
MFLILIFVELQLQAFYYWEGRTERWNGESTIGKAELVDGKGRI